MLTISINLARGVVRSLRCDVVCALHAVHARGVVLLRCCGVGDAVQ